MTFLGINPGDTMDWKQYIIKKSILNNNIPHEWNALNSNGMSGQGNGFKLNPSEYQILPYCGSSCWFSGSFRVL